MVMARRTVEAGQGEWPRRLADVRAVPPLRVDGVLAERAVAIALVGSRAAPRAVIDHAEALAQAAAALGAAVVSGGALGVDGAAHRGALAGGGYTQVVLGTGLDRPYPERHRGLFAQVLAAGGALLSQFPDDATARPGNFVSRNRVIAALADLTIVVGAEPRSGSLHTARLAVGLGRRLAAVPGTAGTDALIAAGAAAVERPADLERALTSTPTRALVRRELEGLELAIAGALDDDEPRTAEQLASATGLRPSLVAGILTVLAADGWAVASPRGYLRARA